MAGVPGPRFTGPRRDVAVAAGAVLLAYMLYFAARIVGGGEVEPAHVAVQLMLQPFGIGALVGIGSFILRRFS